MKKLFLTLDESLAPVYADPAQYQVLESSLNDFSLESAIENVTTSVDDNPKTCVDWDDSWLKHLGLTHPGSRPFLALSAYQASIAIFCAIKAEGLYTTFDEVAKRFKFKDAEIPQLLIDLSDLEAEQRRTMGREVARRLLFQSILTQTIPFDEIAFGRHSLVDIAPAFDRIFLSDTGALVLNLDFECWFPRTLVGVGSWKVVARPIVGPSLSEEAKDVFIGPVETPYGWCWRQILAWINRKWNIKDWIWEYDNVWKDFFGSKQTFPTIDSLEELREKFQPRVRAKSDFYFSNRSGQSPKRKATQLPTFGE